MVKNILAKLLGHRGGDDDSKSQAPPPKPVAEAPAAVPAAAVPVPADIPADGDPVGFVEHVVKALVDTPDEVKIETQEDERGTLVRINCRKDEVGRIVGKQGKTIEAIRALVKAGAARQNRNMSVVIVEE